MMSRQPIEPTERGGPGPIIGPASAASSPAAGGRVGRYVIQAVLGRGGMGVVYRAWDPTLRRAVAIKQIVGGGDDEGLERFLREARVAARLRHPGIVGVIEIGVADGCPFIVMDLVEGESLETRLDREPLPARALARCIRDVALAIQHAHDHGVVHRDVKPQNLLLDRSGGILVTDFGLARDEATRRHLTLSGDTLGTPAYMAPEQAAGRSVGPPADIWALGAVLYRGLAGRPPFVGQSALIVLQNVLAGDLEPLRRVARSVDPGLAAVVHRCLERDQADRYARAGEVAEELDRWLAGGAPRALGEAGILGRTRRWLKRSGAWTGAAVAALAVTSGISFGIGIAVAPDAGPAAATSVAPPSTPPAPTPESPANGHLTPAEVAARRGALRVENELDLQRASNALIRDAGPDAGRVLADRLAELSEEIRRAVRPEDARLSLADRAVLVERRVPRARLYLTQVCVNALTAIDPELAPDAIDAYLAVEVEIGRAMHAMVALCVTGGHRAREVARRAEKRFGHDPLWPGVAPYIDLLDRTLEDAPERMPSAPGPKDDPIELLEARAVDHIARREGVEAERIAARVIELDPGNGIGWRLRGTARRILGRLDGAERDLRRALEIDPRDALSLVQRSYVHIARGDAAGARDDALAATRIDPDNAAAWSALLGASHALGDEVTLRRALDRAIELAPGHVTLRKERATRRIASREYRGAIEDLEAAVRAAPDDAGARRDLAYSLAMAGQPTRAVEAIEVAIRLQPGDLETLTYRARIREMLGDPAGAVADADRVIAGGRDELDIRWIRARSRRFAGDPRGARDDLGVILERSPTDGQAWRMSAVVLATLGEIDDAERHAVRAIELDPGDLTARVTRARLRENRGDIDGAFAEYERVLAVDPRRAEALTGRARLHAARLDWGRAREDLDRAVAAEKSDASLWCERGFFRLGRSDPDGALEDFEVALGLRAEFPSALAGRGLVRMRGGQVDLARDDFQRYLELAPNGREASLVRDSLRKIDAGR